MHPQYSTPRYGRLSTALALARLEQLIADCAHSAVEYAYEPDQAAEVRALVLLARNLGHVARKIQEA